MNKRGEVKLTPVGHIPKEWEVVRLGEATYLKQGNVLATTKLKEKGYPVYGANGVIGYYDTYTHAKGEVLVTCRGSTCGTVNMSVPFSFVTNNAMVVTPKDPSKLDKLFLFYCLSGIDLTRAITGTGQPQITKLTLSPVFIPLPPLPEQKKIAEILRTVDGAIEKVDETIERTERLKKGLMQELLTKGIGHREFKDAEIGRIPKEWEVVKLGDIRFFKLIMGQSPPSSTYNKSGIGIPFLQGCAEFGKIYPSPNLYCSKPLKIVRLGDILISVRAPVGEINIADTNLCIGRGLAALRPKEKSVNTFYIYYALHKAKGKLKNRSSGSTFKAIAKRDLENFQIPLPPLPEQKQIAKILMTVDKKLELLREKKKTLEQLKKGLMNGLLTGRRRVKVEPPKETLF